MLRIIPLDQPTVKQLEVASSSTSTRLLNFSAGVGNYLCWRVTFGVLVSYCRLVGGAGIARGGAELV